MGYKIFILCLRQVFNNWRMTVRLSWFWLLLLFVCGLGLGLNFYMSTDAGSFNGGSAPANPGIMFIAVLFILMIAIIVISFVGVITIAIGWHRYILREEVPENFYVLHRDWPLGKYFWKSLLMTLTMILLAVPLILIGSLVLWTSLSPEALSEVGGKVDVPEVSIIGVILILVLGTFFTWIALRMGMVLPAIAVGEKMTFRESFKLSGVISGSLLVTAFCVALLQCIPISLEYLLTIISGPESTLVILFIPLIKLLFFWLSFFVSIGVLTVLYGHLVENKPI